MNTNNKIHSFINRDIPTNKGKANSFANPLVAICPVCYYINYATETICLFCNYIISDEDRQNSFIPEY